MMRKKIGQIIMLLGFMLLVAACGSNDDPSANAEKTETTDETANEAEKGTLETDGRIVATTVALTEIANELELDLVGIPSSYKDLPDRYKDATEVGMAMEPDMEIIRSLKPTDVLSVTTLQNEFNLEPLFDNAGVPVTFVDMESVEGMYQGILDLGEKYDRTEQAEAIVDNFENLKIEKKYKKKSKIIK